MGGRLLDKVYADERLKLKETLDQQYQTLSIDSWTGPSNRPILGTAIGIHILGLLDTSGIPHDAAQIKCRYPCCVRRWLQTSACSLWHGCL